MESENALKLAEEIMMEFAALTGLEPLDTNPKRYLWTDAFAVCNYIQLYSQTEDKKYLDLAIRLVNQVHHVLGKHRQDDSRSGWISGLRDNEAELHPTIGGLRIGKKLNERKPNEPIDQRLEWDQDGQYYHYLTKWMHALNRVGIVTQNPIYLKWAVELAKTAHEGFTYLPAGRERKMMYWKMSIDLSYPLVPSIGQHDPLDGFVTYNELQISAKEFNRSDIPQLDREIGEMADICRGMNWTTNDPLGIGGILFDATRVAKFIQKENMDYSNLLQSILESASTGINSFVRSNSLKFPPDYRLAFRELGLSIGLKGIKHIENYFNEKNNIYEVISYIMSYFPIGNSIEEFWTQNRHLAGWIEHKEINMVMLATSLIPDNFLSV